MMKMNKKLLTRLFAILASLVLVLALAIPCFADEVEAPTTEEENLDKYWVSFETFGTYEEFYNYITVDHYYYQIALFVLGDQCFRPTFANDTFVQFSSEVYYYATEVTSSVFGQMYINFYDNRVTVINVLNGGELVESLDDIDELNAMASEFDLWVYEPVPLDELVPDTPEIPDTPTEPSTPAEPEAGWYGQVKTIIKNAVFGENTLLNEAQQFTLDQISMWLTLIVILLPLIVGAVILVRCFR